MDTGNFAALGIPGAQVRNDGMIEAFNKIAMLRGAANPSDLADSISKALITTFLGLTVAIPTTAGYMFFRNRVMKLSQEASAITSELIDRFRKVE